MEDLIARYGLLSHPEGGHYREVHRSSLVVRDEQRGVTRHALTAIHFLLQSGERSRWHQVLSEEVWHHAGGAPVELLLLDPELKEFHRYVLGPADDGHPPFAVVPAHWWQAARTVRGHTLCSCFVAPGFEFADFRLMDDEVLRATLRDRWPDLAGLL